jgi:uncharacterized glyoxalase superfamily protein PhnB
MDALTRRPAAPAGHGTVNPFIIADDADGLVRFLVEVFGATERPEARTVDGDGLLLHAELTVGDTTVMLADRKPDWPFTPSFLQVYVDDVENVLDRARDLDAVVVTAPTPFFGDVFSRFRDPWSNLWWVYRHGGRGQDAAEAAWESDAQSTEDGSNAAAGDEWDEASPELRYIHDTLLVALTSIKDPRSAEGGAR